jgi:HKD family nuclease
MQQIPKKKKVGEMGKPDNSAAMEKEFEISFKKTGPTVKVETKKEMDDAEKGKGKIYVEKKMSINDPRKPRLMNAIDRAKVKLKNMY